MRRRVLMVWLALVATVTGVLLTATPSEASAAKAQLSWVSSSGLTTFDFGTVDAGQQHLVTASLRLQNVGGRASGVLSVAVTGASSFAITDDCARNSLGAGRWCTVTVTYRPTANLGAEAATLSASSKKAIPASIGLAGRSAVVPGPQPTPTGASLAIDQSVYPCGGPTPCWGAVVGSGLRPGTMVVPLYVGGNLVQLYDVPASGVINERISFECYEQFGSFYATAITASGEHIASDTVQTPCLTSVP
jgi:hypothetical protein